MNEMYELSIVTHYYGVIGVLLVVFLNMFVLQRATNISKYKRQMSLFTPIASTVIGSVIFTGVIMMAAKHLDFTIKNIAMIIIAIVIIVLEVVRSKKLRFTRQEQFLHFKNTTYRNFALQIIMLTCMTLWMIL